MLNYLKSQDIGATPRLPAAINHKSCETTFGYSGLAVTDAPPLLGSARAS
jgi:hypothetical protein